MCMQSKLLPAPNEESMFLWRNRLRTSSNSASRPKNMDLIIEAIKQAGKPKGRNGTMPFDAYTLYYVGQGLYQVRLRMTERHGSSPGHLAQFLPVGVRRDRNVQVVRRRVAEQPLEQDLAGRRRQEIIAPDHLRDACKDVDTIFHTAAMIGQTHNCLFRNRWVEPSERTMLRAFDAAFDDDLVASDTGKFSNQRKSRADES